MGKQLKMRIATYLGELDNAYALRTVGDPRWVEVQWSLLDMLAGPGNENLCVTAQPGTLTNTTYLEQCVVKFLQAGLVDEARKLLADNLPSRNEDYVPQFRHTFERWTSVEMSLATLAKMLEDREEMSQRIQSIQGFLEAFYAEEKTLGYEAMRTYSLLHALRGERSEAIDTLGKAIEWGHRDWSLFMHPAYNELRNDPAFVEILERWAGLVNEERAKLGLEPRQLNYEVGPGVLPFLLEGNE